MQRQQGYTLVEMLIVSAVLGLVMTYMMQTVTYQQNAYIVTEQVSAAQQNLRLISDLMEREVRVAGYMVPPAAAACGIDSTISADTLFVSAADKVRAVDSLEAIDLELVKGNLGAPVSGLGVGPLGTGPTTLNLAQTYVDVQADGIDFTQGAGVILVDRDDTKGVVACGRITNWPVGCASAANPCNSVQIDFEANNFVVASASANIVAIPAHVYRVVPETPAAPGQLFRDNDLMATDVEDLQLVFYYDDDGDRVVDPGELFGDAGTAALPAPTTIDHNQLIEIRVNLITVTRADDPNDNFVLMQGQTTGNRSAASVVGPDRRRRRVHQSTVRLRNLG